MNISETTGCSFSTLGSLQIYISAFFTFILASRSSIWSLGNMKFFLRIWAVFFHISLGICHGTQQAVVTAYRVYQNVWTSISGRSERFEPFFLQNIHVWYMKGELESAWYAKELKIRSWEAIFTTLGALAPHIEDEPRNEEQHCKNQMLLPIDHPNQIRSSFLDALSSLRSILWLTDRLNFSDC